jgi:hypothetical protein
LTQALRWLYGVSPTDSITLTSVVGIVLAVATIAAAVPALRAGRLDAAECFERASERCGTAEPLTPLALSSSSKFQSSARN